MSMVKDGRRRLPNERVGRIRNVKIGGHSFFITVNPYEDGTVGELFVVVSKEGSTLSGFADWAAKMTSSALQYGMPVSKFIEMNKDVQFEPSGVTDDPSIPYAKSLPDYIARWFEQAFLPREEELSSASSQPEAEAPQEVKTEEGNPYLGEDLGRWDKKTGAAK